MNIREAITVSDIPTPGALMGTTGSAQLIQSINESFGASSFFGSAKDIYASVSNAFVENVVRPIQEMGHTLKHMSRTLMNPDEYRPLLTLEEMRYTPPCMQLPIVMYAPVRKLLEQGRISGYGYDPDNLPEEDVFGRLCSNGLVEDILEACGDNDACDLFYEWHDDDPDLTLDEIAAIQETRAAVDYILESTLFDPTDPTSERG